MLELKHSMLRFSFPKVHAEANVGIQLQRTIRIPDDGKDYPLPPSLGVFPTRLVDEPSVKNRVPAKWLEHGGVMLPMYQAEAMWISFRAEQVYNQESYRASTYPFAVKISAGMKSCVTGETRSDSLAEKDYVVLPKQPWIDGFVVEKGKVRQFVAAPLGMGFTAEEQLSGKAEFGGLQVEVFPMKAEVYEKRFPLIKREVYKGDGRMRRMSLGGGGASYGATMDSDGGALYACAMVNDSCLESLTSATLNADMGLGAGGSMNQQIFEDPFDFSDWDIDNGERCFIHLANSLAWRAITGLMPPPPVATAAQYASCGYPWYDHYKDDVEALEATDTLKNLKSILEFGFQKGFHILPENESADVKKEDIRVVTAQATPTEPVRGKDEVADGKWNG